MVFTGCNCILVSEIILDRSIKRIVDFSKLVGATYDTKKQLVLAVVVRAQSS